MNLHVDLLRGIYGYGFENHRSFNNEQFSKLSPIGTQLRKLNLEQVKLVGVLSRINTFPHCQALILAPQNNWHQEFAMLFAVSVNL